MIYKNRNWDEFDVSFLHKFNCEIPVFKPSVFREFRGEIFTSFHSDKHPVLKYIHHNLDDLNYHTKFAKSYQGVLRGLHYDNESWKLVQSISGDIYFVVVDYRKNSINFSKWESYILNDKENEQILIPPGFASGYYALTDCIFHYNFFYPNDYVDETKQGTIRWNDPKLNIEWPNNNPTLQLRDR
jgi:dTDP-4-dehydrorhamnose 3,5-epimerase